MTESLTAAAKTTSREYAVPALLSEVHGIFTLKEERRTLKSFTA